MPNKIKQFLIESQQKIQTDGLTTLGHVPKNGSEPRIEFMTNALKQRVEQLESAGWATSFKTSFLLSIDQFISGRFNGGIQLPATVKKINQEYAQALSQAMEVIANAGSSIPKNDITKVQEMLMLIYLCVMCDIERTEYCQVNAKGCLEPKNPNHKPTAEHVSVNDFALHKNHSAPIKKWGVEVASSQDKKEATERLLAIRQKAIEIFNRISHTHDRTPSTHNTIPNPQSKANSLAWEVIPEPKANLPDWEVIPKPKANLPDWEVIANTSPQKSNPYPTSPRAAGVISFWNTIIIASKKGNNTAGVNGSSNPLINAHSDNRKDSESRNADDDSRACWTRCRSRLFRGARSTESTSAAAEERRDAGANVNSRPAI